MNGFPTLADLFAAADAQGCPVIHICKLAGRAPVVLNRPCLAEATGTLLDLSVPGYFALMAEFRRFFTVESDQEVPAWIFAAGGDPDDVDARSKIAGRILSGVLEHRSARIAATHMLDAAGQETTVIYRELASVEAVQRFWKQRAAH